MHTIAYGTASRADLPYGSGRDVPAGAEAATTLRALAERSTQEARKALCGEVLSLVESLRAALRVSTREQFAMHAAALRKGLAFRPGERPVSACLRAMFAGFFYEVGSGAPVWELDEILVRIEEAAWRELGG